MIEFVLIVYVGANIYNQTQTFVDIDRCLYFRQRLAGQYVQTADGPKAVTAACLPKNRSQ